jgi:hypothetical protein
MARHTGTWQQALALAARLGLPMLLLAGCEGGGGGGGERGGADQPRITAARAIELHSDSLMAIPGVVGVYEGLSKDGETVLRVMLAQDADSTRRRIPPRLEGYPVEIEVTGRIEPMR